MLVTNIFSFSHNVFKTASFSRLLKVSIVWYRVQWQWMGFAQEKSVTGYWRVESVEQDQTACKMLNSALPICFLEDFFE